MRKSVAVVLVLLAVLAAAFFLVLPAAAAESGGRLQVVHTRGELKAFVDRGGPAGGRVAAVLATEGLHPLEGRLENVDRLYDAGFRIAGLTHFLGSELGGSAHGERRGGCGLDAKAIARAIRYTAGRVGVQHVALGSDFDGATRAAFDTTGLPLLTQGLLEAGFSESDVAAIMGGNVLRLLLAQLPA